MKSLDKSTKLNVIFISVLLIISAIIIEILLDDTTTKLDAELVQFFVGFIFIAGFAFPLKFLFEKKK